MIHISDAQEIAKNKIAEMEKLSGVKLKLLDEETIEFEFGWVFFYQSEEYLKTGDILDRLGGNAPLIVDKFNGQIYETGTRMKPQFYIEKYRTHRNNIGEFYNSIR